MSFLKKQFPFFCGSLVFLIVSLALLGGSAYVVTDNLKFERSKIRLEAKILRKWNQDQYKKALPGVSEKVASTDDPTWYLQVEYTDPSGQVRNEKMAVARRVWLKVKAGGSLSLRWLEEEKKARAEIDPLTFWSKVTMALSLSLLFFCVSIVILVLGWKQFKLEALTRASGRRIEADAILHLKEGTRFAKVKGSFPSPDGKIFNFDFAVSLSATFQGARNLKLVLALCPSNAQHFLIVQGLPEGLQVLGPSLMFAST